ncbi:hypothetical protein Gogos_004182 [Gossypium gossypioides]|uniref:DUF7950 domain-containing protein n=1 Tax=Gossypium gossypioides TaxID=34282 RepID=A0A7J9CG25_GOSGO|nr:hypothetical protein [Gossypium gossypioides]
MIKTLNPYSAKTAEIMSRYRPIAPKPEVLPENSIDESSAMSQKMRQSPYLRNLWPQLQARPSRNRKRGRGTGLSPPPPTTTALKRARTQYFLGLSPPPPPPPPPPPSSTTSLVTLPLLPCLKVAAHEIPEEKDFLKQLQGLPVLPTSSLITPQPIRPVGSTIIVGCINEAPAPAAPLQAPKKPEEVEDDIESESMPTIISDSNNKVRLANSAYKAMVGQPECPWLDSMVKGSECKRICGEVMLNLSNSRVPVKSKGFSCWVRIEWGNEGNNNNNKGSITAFCDVVRLSCQSKDYLFTWRFHIPTIGKTT